MKNLKGTIVFVVCIWGVVVSTYAASVQSDYFLHKSEKTGDKKYKMGAMVSSSCSSSTSSGGAE